MADHSFGLLDVREAARVDRKRELEARFCALLNEKLEHEAQGKACEAEMFRIQGALSELDRPDPPALPGTG